MIKVNYIKYKFKFNDNINKSSYLYQKIFRSIYGYQQNVTKSSNKTYIYKRPGILSNIPYIKTGRNSIILPIGLEVNLIEFFNTGKNPAHNWRNKGNWDVKYSINKIDIPKESVIVELEDFIKNYSLINLKNKEIKLLIEINNILENKIDNRDYIINIINQIKHIINFEWFKDVYNDSEFLISFNNNYLKLKEVYKII